MAQKNLTPEEKAKELFLMEFGSLQRLFNPCSLAYDGYKFVRKLITLGEKTLLAFVAWDNRKENLAVVAEDGSLIEMVDYNRVGMYEVSANGAREAFKAWYPTLSAIFNPAACEHSVDQFHEGEKAFCAVDFSNENKFVVPLNGREPYICDPASRS